MAEEGSSNFDRFVTSSVHLPKWVADRFCKVRKLAQRVPTNNVEAPISISKDEMILQARRTLDMDIEQDYNFGVCGPQGAGEQVEEEVIYIFILVLAFIL